MVAQVKFLNGDRRPLIPMVFIGASTPHHHIPSHFGRFPDPVAAIGLILPAITGIAPVLVPLAATGVAIIMVGAIVTHVRLREPLGKSVPAIVLLLLAIFVAWGRFGAYAF